MTRKNTPPPHAKSHAPARPGKPSMQARAAAPTPALDAFAALRAQLGEVETGPPSRGFGADALKVGGKIFAALSDG